MMPLARFTALATLLCASAAQADLTVGFSEGAPKDRFTFTNNGDCALPPGQITLDLGTAPAGLIFDVTSSGAGVEVFQPFELIAGQDVLRGVPVVKDGDAAIVLDLDGLGVGDSIAFTIDVDDTGGGREITVSGSEIVGASVAWRAGDTVTNGSFAKTAQAVVPVSGCTG